MKSITDNKIELNKEDFSFVCPLKTDDMKPVNGGYFCGQCEKKVHDVSDFTTQEFRELKKKSNVCVTFKKVAVVSLVLGLSACSTGESRLVGKVAPKEPCNADIKPSTSNNRLTPFKVLDKNKTIKIDRVEEVNIAGEPMPVHLLPKEK